jgi:hypothetical protein
MLLGFSWCFRGVERDVLCHKQSLHIRMVASYYCDDCVKQ